MEFSQKLDWITKQKITLGASGLDVESSDLFLRKDKRHIKYQQLDPSPVESKKYHLKSLVAAVLFLVGAALLQWQYLTLPAESGKGLWVISTAFFVLFLFMSFVFNRKSRNFAYYKFKAGNGFIVINNVSPDVESVNHFKQKLEEQISKIRYPKELPRKEQLQIYIRHLIFLRDEGVITDDELRVFSERLNEHPKDNIVSIV